MSEPTLATIQTERAAQKAKMEADHSQRMEMIRIGAKRAALAGLAQGLEALDAELAMSKKLRKQMKDHEGVLKLAKSGAAELANDQSLTAEAILEHHDQVKKLLRNSPIDAEIGRRNAFAFGFDSAKIWHDGGLIASGPISFVCGESGVVRAA